MHHIHHTEGLILSSKNFGEASKQYCLFTKDLGMMYASARGVRKMSSKLRFVLQDFAYVRIDLVEGRNFWRITSASKTNELEQIITHPPTCRVYANLARLLRRLLVGIEANPKLFVDILDGLTILEKLETKEEIQNAEIVIVLRMLDNLGYIGDGPNVTDLVRSPLERDLVFQVSKSRREVLRAINNALKETQL